MFKFLNEQTPEQAITGAYYALRLIRHRGQVLNTERGWFIEGLASEPSADERALGLIIIKEIEKVEQVTLGNLNERRAQVYSSKLSAIIEEQAEHAFGHNKARGRELLAELSHSS